MTNTTNDSEKTKIHKEVPKLGILAIHLHTGHLDSCYNYLDLRKKAYEIALLAREHEIPVGFMEDRTIIKSPSDHTDPIIYSQIKFENRTTLVMAEPIKGIHPEEKRFLRTISPYGEKARILLFGCYSGSVRNAGQNIINQGYSVFVCPELIGETSRTNNPIKVTSDTLLAMFDGAATVLSYDETKELIKYHGEIEAQKRAVLQSQLGSTIDDTITQSQRTTRYHPLAQLHGLVDRLNIPHPHFRQHRQ